MTRLHELKISHARRGDLKLLTESSDLSKVKSLKLFQSHVGREDAEALLQSDLCTSLRKLMIVTTSFDQNAIEALATGNFPNVLSLGFGTGYDEISDIKFSQITTLFANHAFPQLRKLGLDWILGNGDHLVALSKKVKLPELRILSFQNNQCSQAAARDVLDSGAFPKLSQLRVYGSLNSQNLDMLNEKFEHKLKLQNYASE